MKVGKITIHCTATPNGKLYSIENIRRYHVDELGWDDVGYHMVIQPDGECQRGRPLNVQGAHVLGHNEDNIGIALVGTDKFTEKQFNTLRYQLSGLFMTNQIYPWDIMCHYEFNRNKTCPNIDKGRLMTWYLINLKKAIEPYLIKKKTPWREL